VFLKAVAAISYSWREERGYGEPHTRGEKKKGDEAKKKEKKKKTKKK
jgi:hypothetical protein